MGWEIEVKSYKTKETYIGTQIKDGMLETFLYITNADDGFFDEYYEWCKNAILDDDDNFDNSLEIYFNIEDILNNMILGQRNALHAESKQMFTTLRARLSSMIDKIDNLEFIERTI